MSHNHIFRSGPKYTILSLSGRGMFGNILLRPRAVHQQSGKLTEIRTQCWGLLGPANFDGGRPKIVYPLSKITPISDLLSYKSCLLVERPLH